jgi:hypothetical protein
MKSFFGVNIIDDVHCTGHADSVASRSIYYAGQEECTFSAVHVAVEAVLVRLGSVRAHIFVITYHTYIAAAVVRSMNSAGLYFIVMP